MSGKVSSRLFPVLVLVLLSACGSFPRTGTARGDLAAGTPAQGDAYRPSFENKLETEHFILRWTNASSHAEDNISDPELVRETAGYFEAAWTRLTELFGRTPYVQAGSRKVEVIFHDLECYAYADPPEGPIELNSSVWMRMPSIRQSTSAHELFHKLQYAYGYKTRWTPSRPVPWFIEGTAAWAEVFVWGRVTRNCKMEDMFKNVSIDLYETDDIALPFWIYFVSGNRDTPKDRLMVKFFEKCEKTGDVDEALFDSIRDAYGSVDSFFLRFALARKNDFWREAGPDSCSYARILGPDGKDLVCEIKKFQRERKELSDRSTNVQ